MPPWQAAAVAACDRGFPRRAQDSEGPAEDAAAESRRRLATARAKTVRDGQAGWRGMGAGRGMGIGRGMGTGPDPE